MKYKAVGLQHGFHHPLRYAKRLVGNLHSGFELAHDLRFGLKHRKFLLHDRGAFGTADVTHDLLAATAKTEFVVGTFASLFCAHAPLARQLLQVVCRQSECGKRGKLGELLVFDSMIVAVG